MKFKKIYCIKLTLNKPLNREVVKKVKYYLQKFRF